MRNIPRLQDYPVDVIKILESKRDYLLTVERPNAHGKSDVVFGSHYGEQIGLVYGLLEYHADCMANHSDTNNPMITLGAGSEGPKDVPGPFMALWSYDKSNNLFLPQEISYGLNRVLNMHNLIVKLLDETYQLKETARNVR